MSAGERTSEGIEVIATTVSGSVQDWRKLAAIEPAFRQHTTRPVRLHQADSHAAAGAITRDLVRQGARYLISAGGAGTFNAVVAGAHIGGQVPPEVRLAFLRKGSADLLGKALGVPDDLPLAVESIVNALEQDRSLPVAVLCSECQQPDGSVAIRRMVGFGGVGVLGEVPRFTESRWKRHYKGVLGSLLGDLGPFYVGLILATVWWHVQLLRGHVPPLRLRLDGQEGPLQTWASVLLCNGDLGQDFPVGRGLELGDGHFRVLALPYRGVRQAWRQVSACRTGAILQQPQRYGAQVHDVEELHIESAYPTSYPLNVDGLLAFVWQNVRIAVSGRLLVLDSRSVSSRVSTPV